MSSSHLLATVLALPIACIVPSAVVAQEAGKSRVWDHDQAVAQVEHVLAVEKKGRPWNEIAWLKDVDEATKRANAEQKPLFVYVFLRKDVGPVDAPC